MTIFSHDFIESSAIKSASYDTEEEELTITFLTGRTYIYVDCPKETYDGLVASKSAGKHFAAIKNGLTLK